MNNQTLEKDLLALKEEVSANKTEGIEERIDALLKQSSESGDDQLIGMALLNKASYLRRLGVFDNAIRYFGEAFHSFIAADHHQLQVSLLNELGTTYLDIGQDDKAMGSFFRALDILNREKTYDVTRASITNNLGTAYYDLEDYEKANSFYQEAYDLLVEENATKLLPIITFNLAESYYYLDKIEDSKKYIQISIDLSKDAEDMMGLTFARSMEEVITFDEDQDESRLLEKYDEFYRTMTDEGDITAVIELSHMFCKILYKHKSWSVLKPILEEVYERSIEVEVLSRLTSSSKMLKGLYIAEGDYESAYKVLEREMEITTEKINILEGKQYNQIEENYKKISNQHYVGKLEDSVRIFKLLAEVGNGIILNKNIEGIFDYIVDHIYSIWDLDVFAVAVIDEEDDSILYHYNTIEEGKRIGKRSRRSEGVLMNYCINNNAEIVINDIDMDVEYKSQYPKLIYEKIKGSDVKSLIFTPMIIGDKVIGGITVQSKSSDYFNSSALEVVRTIAAYCSTAIVNHQRHLKLQKMKDIDGLTGVYNRHALITFNNKLDQRPHNRTLPMFIAMLDIDYFKQYNDNYGHIAGDDCIVQVVQLMEAAVTRYGGQIFRYGGDEFNIIVDACDESKAREMLELIMSQLDAMALVHEYSKVSDKVTLSIGGIVVHTLNEKSTEYYQKVDRLLYSVKGQGRNNYKIVTTD